MTRQIALVTGAAHGIGRAITERLAADGYHVLATDPDEAQLARNHEAWQARGLSIAPERLDCRDRARVCEILDAAGGIDVVVNNAGIGATLDPLGDLSRAEMRKVLEVNLIGTFIIAQEAARRMASGGRIINIASRGYLGGAGASHYVASKAGVVALTRAMATELRWAGITVNAVAPGMIETRALDCFDDDMRSRIVKREPSGGAADPSVIADAVAFLASADARFVNGQVLLVDGGKTMGVPPL